MSTHFLTSVPALARARLLLAASALALLSACQSAPSQPTAPTATQAAPSQPTAPTATQAAPAAASPAAAPAMATTVEPQPLDEAPAPPILGKRADSHGCKPSTGHAWCERTKSCERPWELALKHGFENTPAGWHAYCDGSTR